MGEEASERVSIDHGLDPEAGHGVVELPPVICIGASAGGLEALETVFSNCPEDSGAAFVVIQHLLADHKSMMASLLARHTSMPVELAENGGPLCADHVYLIPPGMLMRFDRGHFQLWPKGAGILSLPIDIFFTSIAASHGSRAVGMILSGTGSDGTRGAAEINAAGGLVLAQQPETAKFDGMPRSVVISGIVDAVLPPERLARTAIDYLTHRLDRAEVVAALRESVQAGVQQDRFAGILDTLRDVGEIDFKEYKEATVLRRVERRMQMRKSADMSEYLDLLNVDRTEAVTLRREILIGVTSFFRDRDAYQALLANVVTPLVRDKKRGDAIRVWCAGVSSGEEPYSVAMMFIEEFERQQRWCQLKVFATDVDGHKIDQASQGIYPESAAAELTPERIERFFTRSGNNLVVRVDLRQHVVFARHNLLVDPPFTRTDLAVCRNTLIYFKPPTQERAMARLLYGLVPGGYLFLGSSESLGSAADSVVTVDSKQKIFRRTASAVKAEIMPQPFAPDRLLAGRPRLVPSNDSHDKEVGLSDAAVGVLLAATAPPSLLVNAFGEVLHLFGDLQPFLTVKSGVASLQLDRLLPRLLASTAFALVSRTLREGMPLHVSVTVPPEDGLALRLIRVTCRPVPLGDSTRHAVISLEEELPGGPAALLSSGAALSGAPMSSEALDQINVLERELQASRESLQATIEELETSNEELQATNEELISANEELQSSNEELQSLNEELHTVNSEFQEKLELLHRTNADLESLARAAGVATVFVDADMRLTRFSPDAAVLFKLRTTDVGRRLDDFASLLHYPELVSDLEHTIQTQIPIEKEVPNVGGTQIFLARVMPYAIPSTSVRGVVATFINITAYHDARRLQAIIDALPEHIAVLSPAGVIMIVNEAWRSFALAHGDHDLRATGPGANYLEVCGNSTESASSEQAREAHDAAAGIRGVLNGTLPGFSMRYPCHSENERRWFVMNVAPARGFGYGAVVSHFNVTSWYDSATHLEPS